jgi:biopolymer transport protein ExbB
MELWAAMGPLARGVVALLAAMSLASLATAVERLLALRRATRDVAHLVPEWRAALEADLPPEVRREVYDRTVRRSLLGTGAALRRGLGVLATVGATAPFVGLVGTVIGVVNAFQEIAVTGQGGVGQVSAGIAEALVTTAVGIGVAVPAVWFFNHLTQRTRQVLVAMECRAEELAVAALGGPARREAARGRVPGS